MLTNNVDYDIVYSGGDNMTVQFATVGDTLSIVRSFQNKQTDYMTTSHIKDDILNCRLIVCKEDNKIVGFLALEDKPEHGYTGIRRACVPNKKNRGRGIMNELVRFAVQQSTAYPLGATPWTTNPAIIHVLGKEWFCTSICV